MLSGAQPARCRARRSKAFRRISVSGSSWREARPPRDAGGQGTRRLRRRRDQSRPRKHQPGWTETSIKYTTEKYLLFNQAPSDVNTTLDGSTYPGWSQLTYFLSDDNAQQAISGTSAATYKLLIIRYICHKCNKSYQHRFISQWARLLEKTTDEPGNYLKRHFMGENNFSLKGIRRWTWNQLA